MDPDGEVCPLEQLVQLVRENVSYCPAGQLVQLVREVVSSLPAGQSVQLVRDEVSSLPDGHEMQVVDLWALVGWYWPDAHSMQDPLPEDGW